ncbi:MAG: hypothetical protein LBS16_06400 [Prevotellaceae bacterium]|jgi:hypothetical protein|nr:hypothetical protein [Prevotellaceae bacterium]
MNAKNIFIGIPLFFLGIVVFSSCSGNWLQDDEDNLPNAFSFGQLQKTESGVAYFLQDDATTMAPLDAIVAADSLVGHRYYLEGRIITGAEKIAGYDYTMRIDLVMSVTEHPIIYLDDNQSSDKYGNGHILFSNAFVTGRKYLNLFYDFYTGETTSMLHDFHLTFSASQNKRIDADIIYAEFHHQTPNDAKDVPHSAIASYDISEIIAAHTKDFKLVVSYREHGYNTPLIKELVIKVD